MSSEQRKQALTGRVKWAVDCAVDCSKKGNTECQAGDAKKKTTLRVIGLSPITVLPIPGDGTLLRSSLGSVEVEEHEVWRVDSKGP